MIDNNTLSLKLEYYFGGGDGTSNSNSSAYPCSRVETDSTVLYKIERAAISCLMAVENADIAEIVEELVQKGIVFFFDEDNQSVSIKQVENVWAELKDSAASSTIPQVSTGPADTADTAEENVEETPDEATNGNDNDTVGNDEVEDIEGAAEAEDTEDTTSADTTATVVASGEGTSEESGCWNTALIILGSDVIGSAVDNTRSILHIFHEKALEVGKYSVELLVADKDETTDTESTTELTSESTVDNNENAAGSVDAVDGAETVNILLFIIREIFHIDAFDPQSLASSDSFLELEQKKAKIEAMQALVNKHFFLNNPHKNVETEGIMMGDGKRIIVKAGSRVSSDNRLPNQKGQTSSAGLRQKLIDEGIIVDYSFASDYEFTSTSAAASVILGQSASGMTAWKDDAGRKLESFLVRRRG